jgi:uncharacterized protein (DUF1697 family)
MAEEIGFRDVRTYIQSGNLVFESDALFSDVRLNLEQRLESYAGKPVGVLLRTAQEVRDLLRCNPFPNAEPNKVGILFLNDAPKSETLETAKGRGDEVIELGAKEIYIHFRSGMGQSKLRLRAMADGTMRNLNTATRLAKMTQGTSD